MKLAVSVLAVSLASAALADMRPGFVVSSGAPFPIVVDFNGDGLDDLFQGGQVLINSGGAFAAPHDLGIPEGEKVVDVLDVNGDHRLDLLTVGSSVKVPANLPQPPMQSPGYRLYIADASRTYGAPIGITSGARPWIADVDGDDKDDFLVMTDVLDAEKRHIGTEVMVLRSLGNGTFDSLAPFRIAPMVQTVQTGDLNHDAATDVVIRTASELVVLQGTGDGRFSVRTRYLPLNQELAAFSMKLGDIDGDSHLDVILPGMRSVRVLFGDGRGNFTRTTRGRIAKVHDIVGFPAGVPIMENAMQPKNLVLGHFTRGDQLQIAAGTLEGDIVILGYEQGALREVSRTATEFWLMELRAGAFQAGGGTDLYVVGALIWGENWPKPRLFYGAGEIAASGTTTRSSGRRRSAGLAPGTALRMQMQAQCVEPAADRWNFSREGIFGEARRGGAAIEAVFDEGLIFYRMNGPLSKETMFGTLTESNGVYSGTTNALTSCGWQVMTVHAQIE